MNDIAMIEVYTLEYNAFRLGGSPWQPIKTSIEEYEELTLGGPCIVFHNPIKDLWHVAVVRCGAIVGTGKTREEVVVQVKKDLAMADAEIVVRQLEEATLEFARAEPISRERFFSLFKRMK